MSADDLVLSLGLPLATFAYCIVSGLVPLVNAELFLVGVAAVAPHSTLGPVALLAAAGQMVAKSVLYLGGRGVLRLPLGKRKADLDALRQRVERWRSRDALVVLSAVVGLPPLYLTSIVAGALRFPFHRFLVEGLVGRIVRFGLVVAVPPLGRWIAGAGP